MMKLATFVFVGTCMCTTVVDSFLVSRRRPTLRPLVATEDGEYSTFAKQQVRLSPRRVHSSFLYQGSVDEPEATSPPKKELTPDAVAEMAELTFVNSCLQLAKGFVDVLKLFIVAVKAGYELRMTPTDMIQRVDSVQHQSAGRDLMPEEFTLRNTWIHVIHLVLETIKHPRRQSEEDKSNEYADNVAIDDVVRETYSVELMNDMRKRHDAGNTFQLDDWLESYSFPNNMNDPIQEAIISQSLRVIWFTFTVLQEEQQCLEEKSGLKAQPPIPGAFD